jgi:hypothetical protein
MDAWTSDTDQSLSDLGQEIDQLINEIRREEDP